MSFRTFLLAPIAAMMIATAAAAAEPVVLPDGTQIEGLETGTGAEARTGQNVSVHYTGWLWINDDRGKSFDSSRGGQPFAFNLGAG